MKITLYLLLTVVLLNSCWAPRCPDKACHVKMEHRHGGQVFRNRGLIPPRVHTPLWYVSRNSEKKQNPSSGGKANKDPKTKKKFKKLLPWEKV